MQFKDRLPQSGKVHSRSEFICNSNGRMLKLYVCLGVSECEREKRDVQNTTKWDQENKRNSPLHPHFL